MSSATSVFSAGRPVPGSPRAASRSPRAVTPSFHFAIRNRQLRVLFEIAAAELGFVTNAVAGHAEWTVTDAIPVEATDGRIILVLADTSPLACRTAVDLVEQGTIAAVLTPDRAALLPDVARLAAVGQASVPTDVLTSAADAPEITERQHQVLRLVIGGWSNHQTAERLHVSATTVKRDVSDLLRAFDCTTRLQLRAAAADLGLTV